MKTFYSKLWTMALCFHIGLMLLFNLTNSLQSHLELYYEDRAFYPKTQHLLNQVKTFINRFSLYQTLSGTDTGYGFYAPQVSSHIEPFFDLYQSEQMVSSHFNLTFHNHEAALRFESVFDQHLEKLDELMEGKKLGELNDNLYYRFLDLRVHSLSTSVLNYQPIPADRVRATLYLYEVPPLYAYTRMNEPLTPTYLKTFDYEYQLNAK